MKCIDDEIPFEIPVGWAWCKINNIAFVTKLAGFEYTKYIADNLQTTGVPLFKGKNVQGGKIIYDFEAFIPESLSDELERSQISKKCLLTPYVGTIGNIGIHNRSGKFHLGSNVGKIEILNPVSDVCILEEYLHIYLLSQYGYAELTKYKKATAQESISIEAIREVLVPIPPIQEQQKIVNKYFELEPLVDKYSKSQGILDRLNAELFEKLKKSVLQEAIQGKLVPQSPDDEPGSVLLERIKEEKAKLFKESKLKKKNLVDSVIFKGEDNKYYETIDGSTECIKDRIPFEIPENWTWVTLGSLVQNCSGLAYKKENLDERSDDYIRVLRGGNIDDGRWSMKDDDVMIAAKFVKPELLLTAGTFITPSVTSIEQMGKTALVRDDQPQTVVGGFVLMLLPFLRDWSLLNYLELIFQSEYYKNYCRSITNKSGQAFYNLSRQKLMQFLVPLPPLNERLAIAKEVAKINSLMR